MQQHRSCPMSFAFEMAGKLGLPRGTCISQRTMTLCRPHFQEMVIFTIKKNQGRLHCTLMRCDLQLLEILRENIR